MAENFEMGKSDDDDEDSEDEEGGAAAVIGTVRPAAARGICGGSVSWRWCSGSGRRIESPGDTGAAKHWSSDLR